MDAFWQGHWWLLIILASFTIPLAGIGMGAWTSWLYFRHRRAAMETLKEYAAQGREPPKDVLDALSGPFGGFGAYGGERFDYADRDSWRAARAERRAARYAARAERWRYREPFRRWHGVIFFGVIAAGLYYASQHYTALHDPISADRFFIATVIVGALAAANLLSAILVTVFRPK